MSDSEKKDLEDSTVISNDAGKGLRDQETQLHVDRQKGRPLGDSAPPKLNSFAGYQIKRELARGGMGVVYQATQTKLNRDVALKMILSGQIAGEEEVRRFLTEAESAARLDHPGIVPIYEVGEQDGQYFYSMAYVDGESLSTRLARSPMSSDEAVEIMIKISDAVAYAHEKSVIHRDLKPGNILIDREGQPRVTDFGLAKMTEQGSDLTATGQILGTPSYMPPEQAGDLSISTGKPSDVYSLGAVFYEMLTGRPPFRGDTPVNTIMQVLESDPVSPRLLNPGLPRDLETICLKCLQKKPSDRYPNSSELADDLNRFRNDEPIEAKPPGLLETAGRWIRKQRRGAVLASSTVAVIGLLIAASTLIWFSYQNYRRGYIEFDTSGAALFVDIHGRKPNGDFESGSASHALTAPTRDPLSLKSGAYQLEVAQAELISEQYEFDITRNTYRDQLLSLDEQLYWEPIKIQKSFVVLREPGQIDLVEFEQNRIKRRDGRTGEILWESICQDQPQEGSGVIPSEVWNWDTGASPSGLGDFDFRPRLVSTSTDLDGDGSNDLIWAMFHQSTVIAISGSSGKLIWQHDSPDGLPVWPTNQRRGRPRPHSRIGSLNFCSDLDGDQINDLIAAYAHQGNRRGLFAISAKTGKEIWHFPLDISWDPSNRQTPSDPTIPYEIRWKLTGGIQGGGGSYFGLSNLFTYQYRQASTSIGTLPYVSQPLPQDDYQWSSIVWGSHWLKIDLKSGTAIAAPRDLGFIPVRSPVYFQSPKDGIWRVLFLETVPGDESLMINCHDVASGKQLWQQKTNSRWLRNWDQKPHRWPLIVNSPGKKQTLIVVPNADDLAPRRRNRGAGLACFDAETGETSWKKYFWYQNSLTLDHVDHLCLGPDLDGDEVADVLVASKGRELDAGYRENLEKLVVEARSSATGKRLWSHERTIKGDYAIQQIDFSPRRGPAAGTVCVLFGQRTGRSRNSTRILVSHNVKTGKVLGRGLGVDTVDFADFDQDGSEEILLFALTRRNAYDDGGRLSIIRGDRDVAWRRLGGDWNRGNDFDGDGLEDLMHANRRSSSSNTHVILGNSGTTLWRTDNPLGHGTMFQPLSEHGTDLNNNGSPDVLSIDPRRGFVSMVSALDGKTGEVIWRSRRKPASIGRIWDCLTTDLDGDGGLEIVIIGSWSYPDVSRGHFSGQRNKVNLIVIDGETGITNWEVELYSQSSNPAKGMLKVADINQDGTLDLLLPALRRDEPLVRAINGVDGTVIWHVDAANPDKLTSALVTVIDRDSDSEPVVFAYELNTEPSKNKCRVTSIDGNGSILWTWDFGERADYAINRNHRDNLGSYRYRVHALRAGPSKFVYGFPVRSHNKPGENYLIILDASGNELVRKPMGSNYEFQFRVVRLSDRDHDLITFINGNKVLVALQIPLLETAWRLPLTDSDIDSGNWKILELMEAAEEDRITIVLESPLPIRKRHSGSTNSWTVNEYRPIVRGIDAKTGKPSWICKGPIGKFTDDPPLVLRNHLEPARPVVVFQQSNNITTSVPVTLETDDPPPEMAVAYPIGTDSRKERLMPWHNMTLELSGGLNTNWPVVLSSLLVLFIIVVIPGIAAILAIRARRWSLRSTFLATTYVAMAIALLVALSRQYPALLFGPVFLAFSIDLLPHLVMFGFVAWTLLRWWRMGKKLHLVAFVIGNLVLMAAILGSWYAYDVGTLDEGQRYRWSGTSNLAFVTLFVVGWVCLLLFVLRLFILRIPLRFFRWFLAKRKQRQRAASVEV